MTLRFLSLTSCVVALLTEWAVSVSAQEPNAETTFLSNPRQLIYEGRRSGEGYFHPDGNLMVFQSEREEGNPFYQIYQLDLLSGESNRISTGDGKTTCAFFQPGTSRLLFSSTHLDPEAVAKQKAEIEFRASGRQRRYAWDYDPAMEIFSCQQDGTQVRRLTDSPGYDAEASFSPDGTKVVFCSLRSAYPVEGLSAEDQARFQKDPAYFGEIYIMNADGTGVRRLTNMPGYDGGPFFSPDGERILWRRFDAQGMNADVFSMRTDGSDVRRVTDFKSMSWAPYPHPSGSYVIFTSNKLGFENFELFLVDKEGKREPVRVTYTPGFDGLPVFSPDGKRLSWTSGRTADQKSQIFLADWNHQAALAALAAAPLRQGVEGVSSFKAEISEDDLRQQVAWLADPAREGRLTGGRGVRESAAYIARYLEQNSLQQMGGGYLHPFSFDAGVRLMEAGNALEIDHAPSPALPPSEAGAPVLKRDFLPLSFSDSGTAEGEVVFAGYGLSVPEGNGGRYNSYEGLDVKDKVVLILRYVPEAVDAPRRAQLNRYAGLRYKAMLARERGARAVLFVSGPNSPQAGELLPMDGDGALAGSGILAQSITGSMADRLLAGSGRSLKVLQGALDSENPHAEGGFVIPSVRVRIGVAVEHLKQEDHNVVAVVPPTQGDEYVLVGAHYDHLGMGKAGSSMARSGEEGRVHPGADDNASGTAVVMELAAAFAAERAQQPGKFRRGVIFALWSGEEIGLIGSSRFTEQPPVELSKVAAYFNFDMVGRLRDNKLTLQGVGSSKVWRRLAEKRNVAAGFSLLLQDDPYLPTDTTNFYPKRIPVLNFFTGAHEDYHRPSDTPDKINVEGVARIARFAYQIISDVASTVERPDFARVERQDQGGGSRETLRAYLGTIPDYTTEIKGVKISGVRGGSPAEKAGLQGGDVLVEFAGQKITNIYDYTYALDAVKIGKKVSVVVEREGHRVELSVTPEARR